MGDFYYELAVQIVEICNSMQEKTGGLIYLDQVLMRINRVRSRFVNEVSLDDCKRAIKKLTIFGSAYTLIRMTSDDERYMIQSLPDEMSTDHIELLKLAESNGGILTHQQILTELKWDSIRVENGLNFIIKEGIAWLDIHQDQSKLQPTNSYYFISLYVAL